MAAPGEERRRGVFVQQTFKDSVVALVGVNLGDEITRFNGTEVRTANQLATLIGVLPAGTWVSLGWRPALGQGGFGEERTALVRMVPLDTGSSTDAKADTERLASRANRRLAAAALLERHQRERGPTPGVLRLQRDGVRRNLLRLGDELRIELADRVLVDGKDGSFSLVDGKVAEPTAEEQALLDREKRANPFLQQPETCLKDALLLGSVMVDGMPAYRFQVAGGGELEAWYFEDFQPAGYVLRDPVRRARMQFFVHRPVDAGGTPAPAEPDGQLPPPWHLRPDFLMVVADGVVEPGWQIVSRPPSPTGTSPDGIDETLFRRPQ
jgi:hypothetical protein